MLVTSGIRIKQHFDTMYFAFCNLSPPRMFLSWTFFQNIGFNIVPSDPFMSHLDTQPVYSTEEFQALQLIVLVAFGVVDQPLTSCMLFHFLQIDFKQRLGCRFDIMDCKSSLVFHYFFSLFYWNRQPCDCLLNRLFGRRSKKTSLAFFREPAQKANNAKNVSIWWRHHAIRPYDPQSYLAVLYTPFHYSSECTYINYIDG